LVFFVTPTTEDIIFFSLELVGTILGLLVKCKTPAFGKIIIIIAVQMAYSRFDNITTIFFQSYVAEKSYSLGNSIGMGAIILATNIRSLVHKILFMLMIVFVNIGSNFHAYKSLINICALIAVICFVIISFIYQEILNRQDFKAAFESKERLRKFKSLLASDFPIGVLIMSEDFQSALFSNQFFKKQFESTEENIDTIFRDFELEANSTSIELTGSFEPINFSTFLEYFIASQFRVKNKDLIVLPALYKGNNEKIFHYEIKLRQITWNFVPAYAIIFNDVSEKQTVMALKLADTQKDRIIATVSHELRTPINGTLGLLEMISARVTDEVSLTYLKYCKSCNKLLLYLVNSILDLSQLRQNTLHISKDNFLLEELLEELKALYLFQCQDKGIKFDIEKDNSVPKQLFTDRHRLIEILINLVGNAIKFTFNGTVTLKISLDNEDPTKIWFSIIDTGIGVKDEDKSKLFKRFGKIQHKNANINVQGVGLGLTIVQELVVALNDGNMDEKVNFDSEYGKGSSFSFRLSYQKEAKTPRYWKTMHNVINPVTESPTFPREYTQNYEPVGQRVQRYNNSLFSNSSRNGLLAGENVPFKTPKGFKELKEEEKESEEENKININNVLIVDDNPFNILAASFILEKFKCKIDKAFHGQECLELIEKNREKSRYYDLILMDIQMPVMDGPQTSKAIKEKIRAGRLKDVPIIALTAKKSTEEEIEYYQSCGVVAVLEKPLQEKELIREMQSQLEWK